VGKDTRMLRISGLWATAMDQGEWRELLGEGQDLTCYAHGNYNLFHITANTSICELLSSHYLPKLNLIIFYRM
jgi:hypothetical protein